MQFTSLTYALLLGITLLACVRLRGEKRVLALIAASLTFYGAYRIMFLGLLGISAAVDFLVGRALGQEQRPGHRRGLLGLSVVVNLGILGYFKYTNFFADVVRTGLGLSGGGELINVILPPGISFYTFQTMSYTIDVYRGRLEPAQSFSRFLLYVSFFPQLIAGPIERAGRLLPQFDRLVERGRLFTVGLMPGLQLILWGLFKKVVIADHLSSVVESVYDSPTQADFWSAWVASYAFGVQIYCDFSAYSEIARGSALLFGVRLVRNFDLPFVSRSPTDFWRRWHISLSAWFRDYVYIPLGGNRLGPYRTLANVFVTMLLSGLWHGAGSTFVLWGAYQGLLLISHTALSRLPNWQSLMARFGALRKPVCWFATWQLISLGWPIFRARDLEQTGSLISVMLNPLGALTPPNLPETGILGWIALFLAASILEERYRLLGAISRNRSLAISVYIALAVISLTLGVQETQRFIYFQF
ncbi:MAG: MBOAT family protein [Spirochaetales bacterium]|nr:MBOAT family protein [Leptospiraceae bacterium]MCP5481582.1 MBOAT family protein [Spirochaetales bacterium]MCP5484410.1 MBOAT family protein [Spirochaetales bacterium]